MSEKKPRKGKGQFKVKTPKTNPPQNNEDKIIQLRAEVNRYLEEQNYEEAIKCYTKIIEIDPNFKEAYNNRGLAYYNLKDYDKAIDDYAKAIEIDVDNNFKEVYKNRGLLYNLLGEYKKAINDYNKAIKLDVDNNFKEAYNNRGLAYYNLKDYDKAIDDYTKAIEIDDKYKIAYLNRGATYDNLGKCEEAIIDFTKAIEIDPSFKNAYFNRGTTYDNLGKYDKAISDYTKAIEIDSNYNKAYFNRGLVYVRLEKDQESLEDFTLYVEYTDLVIYKLYFLLIKLYKIKKLDGKQELYNNKIADLIKKIINKQKNDSFKSKKTNRDETTNEIIDIIKNKNGEQINIDPHTLYSYVPFDKNTIDAIVQGYKYANEIFDFNDPTDPTIKLIKGTKEMTEIFKNIRIACFSTSPLNVLMYSHYTDKHKGICIEYDFSDFDTENTSLLEVKYKEELKIDSEIAQIMMKSDNDINEEISFLDLFRTKHLNWEYEKEYRVMTYDVDKIYRPIKAIYLGKDISDSDIELIERLIKGRSIKLYQVALHEHNVFRLEAKEI